ncbi:MAG TPA: signal peptidase II [Bacteroidota bacterium]|nr:signal peptidase II [Bacteroidota bacterium]
MLEGRTFRNLVIVLVISIMCIGCDRVAKDFARERLEPGVRQSIFGDLFRLQYEENRGGMLSFGAELNPGLRFLLFTVTVGTMLILLTAYASFSRDVGLSERAAIAMIVGGGLGNLIDRIVYNGVVIDFLNVGVGGIRTAIFNIADVAVLGGVALLVGSVSYRMVRHRST